jgi:arsenite-transporting ATPase
MSDIEVEAVDSVEDDADDGGPGDDPVPAEVEVDADADVDGVEEATETALPVGVDAPEYVLYGGKGGVGKTTCAAATALASAGGGASTLVVSTDPAHSLSDTLAVDVPPEPTRVRDDLPLYAAEIDPEAAMDDSVFDAVGGDAGAPFAGGGGGGLFGGEGPVDPETGGDAGGPLGGLLGGDGGLGSMPGMDEAAAVQQLLAYLDDPRFDRVVVDTAPTGHTLRLLELPEFLDSMTGRLLQLRERMGGMLGGLFGDDAGGGPDLEELRERVERLRAVLRDPARTDFRVVTVPEEMSVVEADRLLDRLDAFGIPVETVVVNRVMEDLAAVAGEGVAADWVVSPTPEDCEFCARRWDVQQRALTRAMDVFRGRDVRRVPLLSREVRGEEALRVVAACLD